MSANKQDDERGANLPGKSKWSHCFLPATKRDIAKLKEEIMATLKDLDDEISGELTTAITAIVAAVTALEGKIAAGADTQPEIDKLKALAASLNTALGTVPPA
jgi:hypothetical protein